jgi:ATP-dependent DNA ligase
VSHADDDNHSAILMPHSQVQFRAAILLRTMSLQFQPMPLLKRPLPFDDPDWIFELKYDGFRALAVIEHGRAQLISRNGHPFASFSELGKQIAAALPNTRAVIDGEICSLDRRGRPQFKNLMFRRGNPPCFFASSAGKATQS